MHRLWTLGGYMADEPSLRAKFNVSAILTLGMVSFAATLTCWGLAIDALEWKDAAIPWITGAVGSLATWTAMK